MLIYSLIMILLLWHFTNRFAYWRKQLYFSEDSAGNSNDNLHYHNI